MPSNCVVAAKTVECSHAAGLDVAERMVLDIPYAARSSVSTVPSLGAARSLGAERSLGMAQATVAAQTADPVLANNADDLELKAEPAPRPIPPDILPVTGFALTNGTVLGAALILLGLLMLRASARRRSRLHS